MTCSGQLNLSWEMTGMVIRKVAIVGSGIMGAQIAALFASSRIQVYLFDIPSDRPDCPEAIITSNLASLKKMTPPVLTHEAALSLIKP